MRGVWVAASNRERVGSADGAVAAIVYGMVAHVGDAGVQWRGLAALTQLCYANGTSVSQYTRPFAPARGLVGVAWTASRLSPVGPPLSLFHVCDGVRSAAFVLRP